MGFSIAGTKLGNWLAVKAQKKKINALQKAIEKLMALEAIAEHKNQYPEDTARKLEAAGRFGARFAAINFERKEIAERMAKDSTNKRPLLLEDLVLFQRVIEKEIEALQNGHFTIPKKTRGKCFLF